MTENTLKFVFDNEKTCNYVLDQLFSIYSIFSIDKNKKRKTIKTP